MTDHDKCIQLNPNPDAQPCTLSINVNGHCVFSADDRLDTPTTVWVQTAGVQLRDYSLFGPSRP